MITVEISNRQSLLPLPEEAICDSLNTLLREEGFRSGEVSVSVVAEAEMHKLNRQYLNHDYHTDVLSFVLERTQDTINGEVIASAAMAIERCEEFDWPALDELRLYLIHGTLHLAGYNDKQDSDRVQMRRREDHYLEMFGMQRSSRSSVPASDGGVEEKG